MPAFIRSLVPMAYVRDLARSIEFYRKLGFEVGNTFVPAGRTEATWAWLQSDRAALMLALAGEPVVPEQQAVLFYLYCDDVASTRFELEKAGVGVGPIDIPSTHPAGSSASRTRTATA